jgi:methylaspartate ammonia-lyase
LKDKEAIMVVFKEKEGEKQKGDQKARIDDDTAFWLNMTKSGKGVIIVIDEQAFISSLANIKEFAAGERRGVKFNHLRPAED